MGVSGNKLTKIKRLWAWCRTNPKDAIAIGCATAFLGYAILLSENSLWRNIDNGLTIRALESEISVYRERRNNDEKRLRELDSTTTAIYQFARERYYMKSPSEDVYIYAEADSLKKSLDE